MHRIVVATGNLHKVEELREALAPGLASSNCTLCSLADLANEGVGPFPEPPERHDREATFLDNATIKAVAYARLTGLPCLADDSGLEVDALAGAPGVISSHYAWDGATTGEAEHLTRDQRDLANNSRLLRELRGIPPADRAARFVCQLVLASGATGKILATACGRLDGRVGLGPDDPLASAHRDWIVPRGDLGFGYDPLILLAPDFTSTVAELAPEAKRSTSHRALASKQMLQWLAGRDSLFQKRDS